MRSESCLPFTLPAPACHSTPYRGGMGGKLNQCASLPVTPKGIGKLASLRESISYGACHQSSLPLKSSLPPHRTTTNVRQAQKQTVSRARAGYQKQNLEAAGIILERIAQYGGEDAALVQWARAVVTPKDAECGRLFESNVCDGDGKG
jgi:hypothetical protein